MVDVAQLAIKVDTTDLARGEASLEALQREGNRAEKSIRSLGTGVSQASNRLSHATSVNRNFGRSIQNASFQIGDFAVQMASGQRASVALAQQLPQLLGGFGVLGAALGAVVAIAGALVPVLFNVGRNADDVGDSIDDLTDAMNALNRAQKDAKSTISDLLPIYGNMSGRARELLDAQRQLAFLDSADALAKTADEIAGLFGTLEFASTYTADVAEELGKVYDAVNGINPRAVAEIADRLKVSGDAAQILAEQFANLQSAQGPEATAAALRNVIEQLEVATGGAMKMDKETRQVYRSLVLAEMAATALAQVDMATGIAAAADEAARLRDNLRIGATGFGDDLVQLPGEGAAAAVQEQRVGELQDAWRRAQRTQTRSGGGGRSPADTFATDLEALRKRLRTEQEVIQEEYDKSMALLNDRRAQEILGEQEHRNALLDVEREYQSKLRELRIGKQDEALGYTASFFGAMAQATAAGGDKLVKASQAFGAIEATINAYRAAAQVLADPSIPFWGKAAAYAQILATGLSAVSAIKGAGSGGGGGGAAAAPAQANTSPRVAITLKGSENAMYSKQQVRDLINAINQEVENGAIVRLA